MVSRRLVAFYVGEHNTRLPHSAFRGETPEEMYFGTGKGVAAQLETGRNAARQTRFEANRKMSCETCGPAMAGRSTSELAPLE